MCCRRTTNARITTIFNMLVATFVSALTGILLRALFGLPYWLVCGFVATSATLIEHYLTLHPSFIIKYITLPLEDSEKSEKK